MGSSTRSSNVFPLLPRGGLTSSTSSTPPAGGFPFPEASGVMLVDVDGLDTSDTLAPGMLRHDGRVANPFEGAPPAVGESPRRRGSTCQRSPGSCFFCQFYEKIDRIQSGAIEARKHIVFFCVTFFWRRLAAGAPEALGPLATG